MGLKIPPKCPITFYSILQFTTIFINFFNFDHFLKLQDDFIGEQGLAALALVNFAEVYEIEGGS